MANKVFIVTNDEVATFTASHQNRLLDTLQSLAVANPHATPEDLIGYAREHYILTTEGVDYLEPQTGDVAADEETQADENTGYQSEEPEPVAEEPEPESNPELAAEFDAIIADDDTTYVSDVDEVENVEGFGENQLEDDADSEEETYSAPETYADENVQQPEPETDFPAETPVEDIYQDEEEEPVTIAFRNKSRFKGLLKEASKVDRN